MVHVRISTNHVSHFVRILSFKKFRLHKVVEEEEEEEELKRREAHWAENPKGRLRQKLEQKKKKGEKLTEPKTQKGGSGKS